MIPVFAFLISSVAKTTNSISLKYAKRMNFTKYKQEEKTKFHETDKENHIWITCWNSSGSPFILCSGICPD